MNSGKVLRLSPNEEVAIRQKQQEERRKARLIQVREQDRGLANKVCRGVHRERELERHILETHLKAALADAHQKELRELEKRYQSRVGELGRGHRAAHNEEELRAQDLRVLLENKQKQRAEARHKAAMKELNANQLRLKARREQSLDKKRKARKVEDDRAHKMAKKPHLPDQPLIMDFVVSKGQRVQFKEADGYACTYYHIPHTVVQRNTSPCDSAHQTAEETSKADEQLHKRSVAVRLEQDEKARMRHRHALAKVKLEKDKTDLMSQLEIMEREDRTRRQKALSNMPRNLFQPVHQRLEMAAEQQRDMEHAFEKLLVKTQGVETALLVPSAASEDEASQEEDSTHSPTATGHEESSLHTAAGACATSMPHPSHDSSSSEDMIAPNIPRPFPVSPPQHPLRSWGARGRDDTPSLTATPLHPSPAMRPTDRATAADAQNSASKTTQTQRPHFGPKVVTRVLSQPDLSMSDTASTLSKGASIGASSSTLSKGTSVKDVMQRDQGGGGGGGGGEAPELPQPPRPPLQPKPPQLPPSEGMKKLMALVQEQQKAWKERMTAKQVGGAVPTGSVQQEPQEPMAAGGKPVQQEPMAAGGKPVQQEPMAAGRKPVQQEPMAAGGKPVQQEPMAAGRKPVQQEPMAAGGKPVQQESQEQREEVLQPADHQESLSISTLSTRDSSLSLTEGAFQTVFSSRSVTHSPAPLSISQYHTTLEASALSSPGQPLQTFSSQPPLTAEQSPPQATPNVRTTGAAPAPPTSQTQYRTTLDASSPSGPLLPDPSLDPPRSGANEVPDRHLPQSASYDTSLEPSEPTLSIPAITTHPTLWEQRPDDHQGLNFHRARVDYTALDARRNLSMSTLTATDYYMSADVCLDSNEELVPPAGTRTEAIAGVSTRPTTSPALCSLQSAMEGTAAYLAPPSLDMASSLTSSNSQTGSLLPAPREQGLYEGSSNQSLEQRLNFHRTRVDYAALESRRDLSMSTTTAMDYSMNMHTSSVTDDTSQLQGSYEDSHLEESEPYLRLVDPPSNPLLHSAVEGTAMCLEPPSLDVTSSSVAAAQGVSGSHEDDIADSFVLPWERAMQGVLSQEPSSLSSSVACATSGSISHPLHAFQRSHASDFGGTRKLVQSASIPAYSEYSSGEPRSSHLVISNSYPSMSSEFRPSPLISPEPFLHSHLLPGTPHFLPLTEASFLAGSPSPSAYTPLKPVTSSPLVQTNLTSGVNFPRHSEPSTSQSYDSNLLLLSPGLGPAETSSQQPTSPDLGPAETSLPHDHQPTFLETYGRVPLLQESSDPVSQQTHGHTYTPPPYDQQVPPPLSSPQSHGHTYTPVPPHSRAYTDQQIPPALLSLHGLTQAPIPPRWVSHVDTYPTSQISSDPLSPQPLSSPPPQDSHAPPHPLASHTYSPPPQDSHAPPHPLASHTYSPPPQDSHTPPHPLYNHTYSPDSHAPPRPLSPLLDSHTYSPPPQDSHTPLDSHTYSPPPQDSHTPPHPLASHTYSPPPQDSHTPPHPLASHTYSPPPQDSHTPPHPLYSHTYSPDSHAPLHPLLPLLDSHTYSPLPQDSHTPLDSHTYSPLPQDSHTPPHPLSSLLQNYSPPPHDSQAHTSQPQEYHAHSSPPVSPATSQSFPFQFSTAPQEPMPPHVSPSLQTLQGTSQHFTRISPVPNPQDRDVRVPTGLLDGEVAGSRDTSSLLISPTHMPPPGREGEVRGARDEIAGVSSGAWPSRSGVMDHQPIGDIGLEESPYHLQPPSSSKHDRLSTGSVEGDHTDESMESIASPPPQQNRLSPMKGSHAIQFREDPGLPTGQSSKTHSKSSLSLQEAFLKKKLDFMQQSQERIQNLELNAKKRERAVLEGAGGGALRVVHTIPHPRLPSADVASRVGVRKREESKTGHIQLPMEQILPSARQREKIKKAEMRERNLRLYNRLPEVKRKMEEDRRSREYAENREKAKAYQQRMQLWVKSIQSQSRDNAESVSSKQPKSRGTSQPLSSKRPGSGSTSRPLLSEQPESRVTTLTSRALSGKQTKSTGTSQPLSTKQPEQGSVRPLSSKQPVREARHKVGKTQDEPKKSSKPPFR